MKSSLFDYHLPQHLIAQEPLAARDASRLLVLERSHRSITQYTFRDIVGFFEEGDVLVLNDTKVLPARVFGQKESGAKIEFLFLQEISKGIWEILVKPSRRLNEGTKVFFGNGRFVATVFEKSKKGSWHVQFTPADVKKLMQECGQMPTPPYIKTKLKDQLRYQTVYAKEDGAIAAPTAGLHFTQELFQLLKAKKIKVVYITLHVGLGTFRPIKAKDLKSHAMDEEQYSISEYAARTINKAKEADKRVFAVGTTVTRALESAAQHCTPSDTLTPHAGVATLFITPSYRFKAIDCLLTNFHLPYSTNLVLVSAFAGIEFTKKAYKYAVDNNFRFYSFGDAMLVL